MEWFGLTYYGCPDPIKDMMREDYKEPVVQPDILEIIAKGTTKRFSDLVTELDIYIGRADGNAYKSEDRLLRMRKKGIFKPCAPNEMYRYPGTNSMIASFWMNDPVLKDDDWHKNRVHVPKIVTDVGRYLDTVKKIDKFFRL